LATSDVGIVQYRRALMDAIAKVEAGETDLPLRKVGGSGADYRGPDAIDVLLSPDEPLDAWRDRAAKRRANAPWPAGSVTDAEAV